MGLNRDCDIDAAQRKTVLALLERHLPNTAAWAYGSRAQWTARPQSDLDMVVFASPEQNGRVSHLREAFEESNLPFRVDLFVWDAVPEQFRRQIEAEHVVLVEKKELRVSDDWHDMPLSDAVLINPKTLLKRGKTYPFVDMAAVNAGSRCVFATKRRKYSGGGARFQTGDTLMARITPCLENGKIARYCALDASETGHGSTEFIVIRGRPNVTSNEFAYYLTQWEGVTQLRNQSDDWHVRTPEGTHAISGSTYRPDSPAPRATRHRPHPGGAGRQDRVEPAHERDAGGDGAGAVPVVVRRF